MLIPEDSRRLVTPTNRDNPDPHAPSYLHTYMLRELLRRLRYQIEDLARGLPSNYHRYHHLCHCGNLTMYPNSVGEILVRPWELNRNAM
jgi:hypothetical protein